MTNLLIFNFHLDVVVLRRSYFGSGSGAIYLDSVVCNGSERTLQHCTANPIGIHDCDHSEDAGVRCGGIIFFCCSHIRRKKGTYMYILILIKRKWGNYIRLLCTMFFFFNFAFTFKE